MLMKLIGASTSSFVPPTNFITMPPLLISTTYKYMCLSVWVLRLYSYLFIWTYYKRPDRLSIDLKSHSSEQILCKLLSLDIAT